MSGQGPTLAGIPRHPALPSPSVSSDRLRRRVAARAERLTTAAAVRQSIVSLAAIVGSPVRNQAGQQVGRLVDIVARVHGDERYPPVTGLVVRVGRRRFFIDASTIATIDHREVRLGTATVDLREFRRRPGEVLLARDVLDHQLVDVDGVQVIRAADLYLAPVDERVLLVGVDVSVQSLLRRLGPKRLRGRPTPDRVIDWDAVQPFGDDLMAAPATVRLRSRNRGLPRLRPSELADLLEDLRRPARQELLASLDPERAADALEEMEPDELGALLREVQPKRAGALIAAMEPDEAIDALRDFSPYERAELLAEMPAEHAEHLSGLLAYPEDHAGGFMTTTLVSAQADETVGRVRATMRAFADHRSEIDAIVVLDGQARLIGDIALFDLMMARDEQRLSDVLDADDRSAPVSVSADAGVGDVAAALIDSRRSSVLVVDALGRPLGRILADDVVDALTPDRGRLHFPRLMQ
jgi:CBS domain-containing protein